MAIITFPFSLAEKDVVPDLLARILEKELPLLIVKCNQAYRSTCEQHRQQDIWAVLPDYFKHERLRFQTDTDAVYAAVFDKSKFDLWKDAEGNGEPYDSFYVPLVVIEDHYRLKWRDIMGNIYADAFLPEKYASAFQAAGIDGPVTDRRMCPRLRQEVTNQWCIGIRENNHAGAPSLDRRGS
jgi:hypothetical protein